LRIEETPDYLAARLSAQARQRQFELNAEPGLSAIESAQGCVNLTFRAQANSALWSEVGEIACCRACGVLERACTLNLEAFWDMPHARTGEMPYIQRFIAAP